MTNVLNSKWVIYTNYMLYVLFFTIPFALVLSIIRYYNNKSNMIIIASDGTAEKLIEGELQRIKEISQDLDKEQEKLNDEIITLKKSLEDSDSQRIEIEKEIQVLEQELNELESVKVLEAHGFYRNVYDDNLLESEYNDYISIDDKIKKSIIDKKAYVITGSFEYNSSKAKGLKFQEEASQYMIRLFLIESLDIIDKLTLKNYDKSVEKVTKKYNDTNDSFSQYNLKIDKKLYKLFISRLEIKHSYLNRLAEEKEQLKIQKEYIAAQKKQEKEERDKLKKLELDIKRNNMQLEMLKKEALNDPNNSILSKEIEALEDKNGVLEGNQLSLNEKINTIGAGYIYIISNIGTYGEGVYKIGFTKRANPEDRVAELSGASVPFKFDTHAFIYDQKASTLENKIHNRLYDYRVNKENNKKEFFKVDLEIIKEVLEKEMNKHIEFIHTERALEYKETLKMEGVSNVG